LNGNSGQVFNVATAATGTEALPLAQAQANFAALNGNSGQVFNVAHAVTGTEAVALGQLTAPAPNLLANGSAEFGSLAWSLPTQAGPTTGVYGEGTYFTIASAVNGTYVAVSADYAVVPGIALTLQAEILTSGLTAGQLAMDLEFLDSTHTVIASAQAKSTVSANQFWAFMSASATTPANTAYWHARFFMASATLTNGAIRKIKVSNGTAASPYSREADFPAIQANFAALNGNSGQVFNVATATTNNEAIPLGQAQSQFAALNGNSGQVFNVATAATNNEAIPLGQAQSQFAATQGSPLFQFAVAAPPANSTNAPQIAQTLGAGASAYVNQTASRAIGATYTNTAGRPLYVSVVVQITLAGAPSLGVIQAYVNSILIQQPYVSNPFSATTAFDLTVAFVVPPGATYAVNAASPSTIVVWYEF
jgi:hypothetical protein